MSTPDDSEVILLADWTHRCGSVECESNAVFYVHWPGRPLQMCEPCANRAVNVGRAMGFELPVEVYAEWRLRVARILVTQARARDAAQRLAGLFRPGEAGD